MTLTEKVNLTTGTGYVWSLMSEFPVADMHVDGSWRGVSVRRAVSLGELQPQIVLPDQLTDIAFRLGIPSLCLQDSPLGIRMCTSSPPLADIDSHSDLILHSGL
jgi:hypothetical protein